MMSLYDAHNHLQDAALLSQLDAPVTLDALVADARAAGVRRVVVHATGPRDWPRVAALARRWPDWVLPAFGLHPWEISPDLPPEWPQTLHNFLSEFPSAPIGEAGLHFAPRHTGTATPDAQHHALATQLALARELHRPLVLHCVRAFGALEALLRKHPPPCGFLIHDYAGSAEHLRIFASLGGFFSCNARCLLEKNRTRRAALHATPADRLLLETDATTAADFLALPALHAAIARELAEDPTRLAARLEHNFLQFFQVNVDDKGHPFAMLRAPFI